MLATALVNSVPAHAKITQTCDGEPGDCPGSSSNPGQGHYEENVNSGKNAKAPPGLNKDN
jgi:hypothetical protein